jgi:hypothetical protein
MLDLTNRNRTLPLRWKRRCNQKLYGLGDIHTDGAGVIRCWIYEHNSNRCLHITLERLCRTFRAV